MTKRTEHCHESCLVAVFAEFQRQLTEIRGLIMTTNSELASKLTAINDQLTKASAEIQAQVQALKDQLAAVGQLTPEAEAALTSLTSVAQALDDLNPDPVV